MKKIAIVILNYWLANSLSLISCATSLAKEGFDIHIFIDSFIYKRSEAHFEEDNIHVHQIDITEDPRAESVKQRSTPKRWNAFVANKAAERLEKQQSGRGSVVLDAASLLYPIIRVLKTKTSPELQAMRYAFHARAVETPSIKTVEQYTRRFFPCVVEYCQTVARHIDNDFVCIIGVDALGLIAATLAADTCEKEKSVPIIYYNQELLLSKECHTFESKILKALEKTCNQMSYFTIIQDERRAKYLREDNKLEAESIVYVPVSGFACTHKGKGSLLQDTYGIPRGKKVLLCAGNMGPWAMCLELAQAAQSWNTDFVLVLHSWREDMKDHPYINQIRQLTHTGKVYLSLMHVDWQKMPELLSSADIGLAFYHDPRETNIEVGHASNKLVQYFQVGLPVIASDLPSLKEVIDAYRCGECAHDLPEIEYLARRILDDYASYRANAFRCYENEYDFSKYFKKVVERIKQIETSS